MTVSAIPSLGWRQEFMDYRRIIRTSACRMLAGLVLMQLVLGCGSDPPAAAARVADEPSAEAEGQANGVGAQPPMGDEPDFEAPISPSFAPTAPVPLTSVWSETIVAEHSENYTFRVTSSAPVRALIDGEPILRDWSEQGSRVAIGSVWLAAGTTYELEVEAAVGAEADLVVEWESPSKARGLVPKSTVAEVGLTELRPVAPFFNGVFPSTAPSSAAVQPVPVSGNLNLRTVMGITSHPNLPHLYIVGRFGQVKYIDPRVGNDTGTVFMDIAPSLFTGQDSGLLNMVFHPQYRQAGSPNRNYVYAFYVADSGGAQFIRVSRFTATEGQNSVDSSTEQIMIQERLSTTLHRGSGMVFGKDGFLYIGLGDFGNPNNGQDISEHLSAGILRIDVDQDPARSHPIPQDSAPGDDQTFNRNYFIPNDNPFVGRPGVLGEYYTLGERNPHRLTMDPATGRMFVGNVGGNLPTSQEEVNEVIKGGNYGWPFREGDTELGSWNFSGIQVPGRPQNLVGTLIEPNLFYERPSSCIGVATQCPDLGAVTEGKCVIGGYVYRGSTLPTLDGRYLLSDCTNGKIWVTSDEYGHGPMEELFTSPFIEVVTFGQDQEGEIYFAGTAGEVYRLAPSGPPVPDPPSLLSQLEVFSNLATLTPSPGVIPYDVSTPLWSDAAKKARWMIVPNDGEADSRDERINVSSDIWQFPVGTVFVKHFEMEQADGSTRRLETRFLVHGADERFYGLTYRWRPDGSDAELQNPKAFLEPVDDQVWHYPSRSECGLCHNSSAGYVLGLKTAQLNRMLYYPSSGLTANVLVTLQGLGLFNTPLMPASLPQMPTLHQGTAFAEERARAYLDANCSHCHRPDGPGRGEFDLRFSTPIADQGIVGGEVVESLGVAGARLLTPQNTDSSIIFKRLAALDGTAMPPLAKGISDDGAVSVFAAWLAAMNVQPRPAAPITTDNLRLSLPANTELALSLAASDPDGDALDYRISRMPVHGTLEGVGKDLVYRPHPDFVGVDGFTFIVSDGAIVSEAGSVQLTVVEP
jgi:uncharacterized repeat protein (TIGR03806 family)